MTGEGGGSRRIGAAGRSSGAESRRRSGACPVCGAKLRNPPRFRRRSPVFFASARGGPLCSVAFVPAAPPEVEKLRVFRLRPPVFSSSGRAFFVLRPGRPAPRGEVCRPSRAYRAPVSHFSFFSFTASPTPRNALTICALRVKALRFRLHLDRHFHTAAVAVGDRRNGRGAKLGKFR